MDLLGLVAHSRAIYQHKRGHQSRRLNVVAALVAQFDQKGGYGLTYQQNNKHDDNHYGQTSHN